MAVILVVDDEPDVRELAAVVLADAGHAVLTAKDGAEAIDLVDRERFNLVIGGVFLAIVLFSPDGLLGLWAKVRSRLGPQSPTSNQRRRLQ